MSKIKKTGVSHYELLYIIPNKFTEDEAVKINEKIKKLIVDNNGNITFSEVWGKKRLAYAIDHFDHGYYNLFEFDLDGKNLEKIDTDMRISNEVLRHQIVKKEVKTSDQIKFDKKIAEKIAAKNIAKEKKEKEHEKATDESKVKLEDLDKRLDKILETDDLL